MDVKSHSLDKKPVTTGVLLISKLGPARGKENGSEHGGPLFHGQKTSSNRKEPFNASRKPPRKKTVPRRSCMCVVGSSLIVQAVGFHRPLRVKKREKTKEIVQQCMVEARVLKPSNKNQGTFSQALWDTLRWSPKNALSAPPQNDQRYQTRRCRNSSVVKSRHQIALSLVREPSETAQSMLSKPEKVVRVIEKDK